MLRVHLGWHLGWHFPHMRVGLERNKIIADPTHGWGCQPPDVQMALLNKLYSLSACSTWQYWTRLDDITINKNLTNHPTLLNLPYHICTKYPYLQTLLPAVNVVCEFVHVSSCIWAGLGGAIDVWMYVGFFFLNRATLAPLDSPPIVAPLFKHHNPYVNTSIYISLIYKDKMILWKVSLHKKRRQTFLR